MPLLFASTLFVSAFLLFLVQPMIGKMILPRLGGTPAVWNTCMLFFQAALLAGYGYTHSVSTYLPVRRQLFVHGALLLSPLLLIWAIGPFSIGEWAPPPSANPIFALLWLLTIVVGLPFFVVATSAPLLQKWFGSTGHPSSKDPYFLYGASNLGSMLALVGYPLWVEQGFDLDRQSTLWACGYGLFFVCVAVCGVMVWRAPARVLLAGAGTASPDTTAISPPTANPSTAVERTVRQGRGRKLHVPVTPVAQAALPAPDIITPLRRLRWVALAAVPSSLMLGVTTFITTDIAAVPLFWVVTLALYLLSFILVFMRWPVEWLGLPHRVMLIAHPVGLALLGLVVLMTSVAPTWLMLFAHLLAFFLTVMVCHGELARDRPPARYLTEFYLWMSVGGVAGGIFNALLAPVIFKQLLEYPLVLVAGIALRPPIKIFNRWFGLSDKGNSLQEYLLDAGYAVCLGLFNFALYRISKSRNLWGNQSLEDYLARAVGKLGFAASTAERSGTLLNGLIVWGIPMLICLAFAGRSLRFGLSLVALLVVGYVALLADQTEEYYDPGTGTVRLSSTIYSGRSFFGVRRVERVEVKEETEDGHLKTVKVYHTLIHGAINHGMQIVEPQAQRNDPITYFHPKGPVGELFTHFKESGSRRPFGVIGLGIGTLASYALDKQHVKFFEIDPAVRDLSLPPDGGKPYFYYLQDAQARGAKVEVDIGDGRLRLKDEPAGYYQILVLDAFSSDAIPVHLLTMESLDLYLDKLASDGVIIYNVTNNFVNLPPVLADQARERKLVCLHRGDHYDAAIPEKYGADWVVLARKDPSQAARQAVQVLTAPPQARMLLVGSLLETVRHPHPDWPPLVRQLGLKESGRRGGWSELEGDPNRRVWRDNYTNLLGAMTWER